MNTRVSESPYLPVLDHVERERFAGNLHKRAAEPSGDSEHGILLCLDSLGRQSQRARVIEVDPIRERFAARQGVCVDPPKRIQIRIESTPLLDQSWSPPLLDGFEDRSQRTMVRTAAAKRARRANSLRFRDRPCNRKQVGTGAHAAVNHATPTRVP